jgi:hypothetical protein
MSKKRHRGVPTAGVTDQPALPGFQTSEPPTGSTGKVSTLPYVRERHGGSIRVDGHEVVATEPVMGSNGRELETYEALLLDDDRTLYGCLKCDAVGTLARSMSSHHRTHSERYSPEVRKVVDRAVRRAMAKASTNGATREPTAEEITAALESGPIREELDRVVAQPVPEIAQQKLVAEYDGTLWAPEPEPESNRTIVEIAQDIAATTDRLEALKREMATVIGST